MYWRLLRMREIVLRLPLGMRYTAVDIQKERNEWIYACEDQGEILSSCQFILEDAKAKMRQVATAKHHQSKGLGKRLYTYCEAELKQQGIREIYCHARKSAIPFYEKLNFKIISEEFEEVGIPHVKMKKEIK